MTLLYFVKTQIISSVNKTESCYVKLLIEICTGIHNAPSPFLFVHSFCYKEVEMCQ